MQSLQEVQKWTILSSSHEAGAIKELIGFCVLIFVLCFGGKVGSLVFLAKKFERPYDEVWRITFA